MILRKRLKKELKIILQNIKSEKTVIFMKLTKLRINYILTLWKLGVLSGYKFLTKNFFCVFLSIKLKSNLFYSNNIDLVNRCSISVKLIFALNTFNPNYFITISNKTGIQFSWNNLKIGGLLLF